MTCRKNRGGIALNRQISSATSENCVEPIHTCVAGKNCGTPFRYLIGRLFGDCSTGTAEAALLVPTDDSLVTTYCLSS